MRWFTWIALLAILLLLVSCFMPWVFIASRNLVVSGLRSEGTNYGKPGYFHFLMAVFYLAFTFIQRIWAKRFNLLVAGLNIAWALRNFILLSTCQMGECPERRAGLYLALFSSAAMLVAAVFPDMPLKKKEERPV
ncbi:MAG TPA: hypothetical protein VG870_11625 [Chitinophagaceae bacterium]|nr:hypothetical protein [Chitinophagaceae bacterium]